MGKREGRRRHLDGEIKQDRKIGAKRVNVSIKLAAGKIAEWEATTDLVE